ncbi:hypothetical protein OPV22_008425 [Ensete ventricosum]|uniref:Signal peptidase complex subunit 1 n=1 Tax=Ensete ventricosum TaxID=4639 RepID=A0AAV8R2W2_ENSVE|nr:hypothetical protein OPV22_008425 [Ensete ventricosum]
MVVIKKSRYGDQELGLPRFARVSFSSLRSAQMDWQGQKRAEIVMQFMLVVFAIAGLGIGYTIGSFPTMMLTYAGGVVITALITVPNWPFFNRHPSKWLDPSEAERHPKPHLNVAAASKKKAPKHK